MLACLPPFLSAASDGPAIAQTSDGVAAGGGSPAKLNCDKRPCDAVARGRPAFNSRTFKRLGGNGRSCADCHMPSESFQLSPAAARARFDALQAKREHNKNADDPLFRPVDADDFRVNGDNAIDFSNLVENGLVRVTMPLPLNVKLIDPATGQPIGETSVDLWRAVMPVLNVAITGPDGVVPIWPPGAPRVPIMGQDPNGPNRQGGYQHDARFGTLQEQARGALFAHAQVSVEPPARMLDDLAAFQQTLFSSPGVELLAEAILSGSTPFPDPDPELNELEQQGKVVFNRACAQCHGGSLHPSGSTPRDDVRAPHRRAITTSRPPVRARPQTASRHVRRGWRATRARIASRCANGTFQIVTTSDPGRLLLTGQPADLGVMDVTQSARNQQDRSVLSQQLRGDARGGARPLRRLLPARGSAESAAQLAAASFVERPRRRSRSS